MYPMSETKKLSMWFQKNQLKTYSIILFYMSLIFLWGPLPLLLGFKDCCSNLGIFHHSFFFFPYISSWISAQINSLMGVYGLILIGQFLFPTAVFALLIFIYSRHVSLLWAVTLAFLAVSVIADYPFRNFLFHFFTGEWSKLGSDYLPEILFFPIPSFSTLYFLGIFYLATRSTGGMMTSRNLSVLTILFSLIIYINAIDIVFALPFWFIYFPLKLIRKKIPLKLVLLKSIFQLILAGIIITPALFLVSFNTPSDISSAIGVYYISFYLVTPLILMGLLFLVQRIDPYDLLYRFRHVYILMLAEVIMLTVALTELVPLNLQISQNRVAQFFAHTYYYLPVIYYASQSISLPAFGTESSQFSKALRAGLHNFFVRYSAFYLLPLLTMLCLYNLMSGIKYLERLVNV